MNFLFRRSVRFKSFVVVLSLVTLALNHLSKLCGVFEAILELDHAAIQPFQHAGGFARGALWGGVAFHQLVDILVLKLDEFIDENFDCPDEPYKIFDCLVFFDYGLYFDENREHEGSFLSGDFVVLKLIERECLEESADKSVVCSK